MENGFFNAQITIHGNSLYHFVRIFHMHHEFIELDLQSPYAVLQPESVENGLAAGIRNKSWTNMKSCGQNLQQTLCGPTVRIHRHYKFVSSERLFHFGSPLNSFDSFESAFHPHIYKIMLGYITVRYAVLGFDFLSIELVAHQFPILRFQVRIA